MKYPLIIKGHEVTIWRSKISSKVKGFIANDEKELQEKTSFILAQNVSCLVQEVILGPDTNHVKYNCYMDSNGNIIAEFMLRKIRQYPIRFGVGSVVESIYDPNLLDVGRQLFSGIGYSGVGSAEFKYDERDKKFKLIEINPRYWQQNYITTASKLNFAYINYCDLLSLPLPNVDSYELGVKWVNIYMDLFSYLDYNKEGSLSLNQWLTSLKGKKTWSDFVVHDPLPVFHEIKKNLAKLFNPSKLQNLIKKCSKK